MAKNHSPLATLHSRLRRPTNLTSCSSLSRLCVPRVRPSSSCATPSRAASPARVISSRNYRRPDRGACTGLSVPLPPREAWRGGVRVGGSYLFGFEPAFARSIPWEEQQDGG